jgi:hypothetical protein
MRRRDTWAAFLAATIACAAVGPILILLYMLLGYSDASDDFSLQAYNIVFVICPAMMLGVVEYNSGPVAAYAAIIAAHFLINIVTSTLLLAPAKLPYGLGAAFVLAVAFVVAREMWLFMARPFDESWPTILIAAALYWIPVAVKKRLDARRAVLP